MSSILRGCTDCSIALFANLHWLHSCALCAFLSGMAYFLGRLAAAAAAHWRRSLALVVAVLVALGVLATAAGGSFTDNFRTPGTESQAALDLLKDRFPAAAGDTANVVFAVDSGTLRSGERAAAIHATANAIAHQPHVTGVVDPLSKAGAGQLSRNGRIAYVT